MDYLAWNIDPEIVGLGSFAPRWYGLLFAAGFVLGYLILAQIYRRERRSEEHLSSLLLYILSGTIIGARLGQVIFYQLDYYLPWPWEILMIWQGGLSSHGGFAGVLMGLYLYSRKYREMSFLELGDRMAIAALPAASLIRIGNLLNSEIVGVPTNLPWAIIFLRVDDVPRHPAMLYEAFSYLLVFAILHMAYWKYESTKVPAAFLGCLSAPSPRICICW
jgi:phosphatidylglycerol:prolipoprotein diacylglycerol transferase